MTGAPHASLGRSGGAVLQWWEDEEDRREIAAMHTPCVSIFQTLRVVPCLSWSSAPIPSGHRHAFAHRLAIKLPPCRRQRALLPTRPSRSQNTPPARVGLTMMSTSAAIFRWKSMLNCCSVIGSGLLIMP